MTATGPAGVVAAGPALRSWLGASWRGKRIRIENPDTGAYVWATVGDWCACRGRLVDLSDDIFRQLAPLSRGVLAVSVGRG